MKHIAIVGAGFGDEGKGHMVDYFAKSGDYERVVRFNGGSQAGHTVELQDGKRFVFSQLGAGSFRGLPTHLSKFMLVNPVFFMREYADFLGVTGKHPKISISPMAQVITPYDVQINRHTAEVTMTTGHGVNAAIQRAYSIPLTVGKLKSSSKGAIRVCLQQIQRFYHLPVDEAAVAEFLGAVDEMLSVVDVIGESRVLSKRCIFEGAQGLLLDQNSGMFPYVTPSNTGLANVVSMLDGDCSVQPVYVTRNHLTRHGSGPMYLGLVDRNELVSTGVAKLPTDETNRFNGWQGQLYSAPLSLSQLAFVIRRDMHHAQLNARCVVEGAELAMTWCNHPVPLDSCAMAGVGYTLKYESHGKTAEDVRVVGGN